MDVTRIGLISCSGRKLDRAAPARELYCSPLFKRSLAYAEARCERVYVLSAQHHLVDLDRVLEPYDRRLGATKRERRRWAASVAGAIEAHHGRDVQLLLLAGQEYTAPLIQEIARWWPSDAWRARIALPLERLPVGARLRWLNEQLVTCRAASGPSRCILDAEHASHPDPELRTPRHSDGRRTW
jgi:hypothetical protein